MGETRDGEIKATLLLQHHGEFRYVSLERPLSAPTNVLRLDEAIADAETSRAGGILLDLSYLPASPDAFDSFYMARHLAAGIMGPHLRVAVLVSTGNFAEGRFIETVCVNRGGFVRVFVEPSDALAWLRHHVGEAVPLDTTSEVA